MFCSMSSDRRTQTAAERRSLRRKFKSESNDTAETRSKETSRNQSRDQSRDQSMDMKDEEMPLEAADSSRLQIAVGAFQRKYRSMSVYGEHVIDIAERSKKALFIFPEGNSLRMFCKRVVENKYPFFFLSKLLNDVISFDLLLNASLKSFDLL